MNPPPCVSNDYSLLLFPPPRLYSLLLFHPCDCNVISVLQIVLPHFIGIHGFLRDWRFWSIHIIYLFTSRALPPLNVYLYFYTCPSLLAKFRRVDDCLSFQITSFFSHCAFGSPWICIVIPINWYDSKSATSLL